MTALTAARDAKRWGGMPGVLIEYGVAASQKIYQGALVALNSAGYAIPAADTASTTVVGVAESTVNSGTTAGEDKIIVRRGAVHAFANDATNALTIADAGKVCYVKDDQTVQDDGAANDIKAGVMLQLDGSDVWVHVGVGAP